MKDDEPEDQPPELPPDASMSIDFSAFGGSTLAPGQLPGKNYNNAALRVLILNVAVIITMAPSVLTFKAAQSVEPVKQDNGSWVWRYPVNIPGHEIEASLTGSLEGFKTVWSMKVTSSSFDPPLEDFEWYIGESSLDNTSGDWLFFDYQNPDAGEEIASMQWLVESTSKSSLVFSNLSVEGENAGDVLSYSVDGTTALISFYKASDDTTAEIEWDLVSTAGSIEVPDYNNGERAHWDGNKQDFVP